MHSRRISFLIVPLLMVPVILLIGSGIALEEEHVDADGDLSIDLWPDGIIWYCFDDDFSDPETIRNQMGRWERGLTLTDTLHLDQARQYIDFREFSVDHPCLCDLDDPSRCNIDPNPNNECLCVVDHPYLIIRDNYGNEHNNMCDPVGIDTADGITELHFEPGEWGRNTALHELGHCLGLWHEHNREDRNRWLEEEAAWNPINDYNCDGNAEPPRGQDLMPILGNYDYDSIMHYASTSSACVPDPPHIRFRDYLGNTFARWQGDTNDGVQAVSDLDISRVLQYYAWEHRPNWGFFTSLSTGYDNLKQDALPDPYLADDVEAVGTPAISYQGPGDYDIFVLGSDHQIYWKSFRDDDAEDWSPMGCCIGSEPAAYSRNHGEIDLLAVEYITGRLFYNHFEAGAWAGWQLVLDGYPPGRIKLGTSTKYIGPAATARNADVLDVFVVRRTDGLLSLTTLENGNWSMWHTVGAGYDVTARPAAIAMPPDQIRLAINESVDQLYEPLVTFTSAGPVLVLGELKGHTADWTPPALARRREDPFNPYRVLITNRDGRISHRFAMGRWRDIGGVPLEGTGPSAVTTGPYSALIVMNGEDAWSCRTKYRPVAGDPDPGDGPDEIQPGGLWLRVFDGRDEEIYYSFVPAVQRE
jgi:hypothetical protein